MAVSYFLFINTNRIKSGRITKKEGKNDTGKYVFTTLCRFRCGFKRDSRGYGQNSGSEKVRSLDIFQDPQQEFSTVID
jgi:hypothetical protein